jgi:hypothetical protein
VPRLHQQTRSMDHNRRDRRPALHSHFLAITADKLESCSNGFAQNPL